MLFRSRVESGLKIAIYREFAVGRLNCCLMLSLNFRPSSLSFFSCSLENRRGLRSALSPSLLTFALLCLGALNERLYLALIASFCCSSVSSVLSLLGM